MPLPEFDAPPIVEVALGIQFEPIFGLRPIELGPLREKWRPDYPIAQEHPPLPPTIEAEGSEPPQVRFSLGPAPDVRLWFLSDDETNLVQLQPDRLIVNWREIKGDEKYPRYPRVRATFEHRFNDLAAFVKNLGRGDLVATQVEVIYVNAIDPEGAGLGHLDRIFRSFNNLVDHHLGSPEQARALLAFRIPDIGRPPVKMYVSADPAIRPNGNQTTFLNLTVRGAPTGPGLDDVLNFMDEAHEHIVTSFTELTPPTMHELWRRTR